MKQPEFPQGLITDLSQELKVVGSSDGAADYKPSFDPLLGLSNSDLQMEITQTIVFNHSLTGTDAAADEGRRQLLACYNSGKRRPCQSSSWQRSTTCSCSRSEVSRRRWTASSAGYPWPGMRHAC